MPNRYAELAPDELERVWLTRPVAHVPWGALEWHGPHLPLGLDGLLAERFAERLAGRAGGVLLPTTWLPITTLPHPLSISLRTETVVAIWSELLAALARAGARVVCIITGHYAQGHEIELYNASLAAMDAHPGLLVLAATPLELLGDDTLLDHAGRWETAQLSSTRPDLVHLDRFPGMAGPHEVAVLGDDPRMAKAAEAEALTARALEAWAGWIERLVRDRDSQPLREWYVARRAAYAGYVEQYYRGSWEEAIETWWKDQ